MTWMHKAMWRKSGARALAALLAGFIAISCEPSVVPATATVETPPEALLGATLLCREQPLMGTRFEIQVYAIDGPAAALAIDEAFAEIARVEDAISEWREASDISALNRAAGDGPYQAGPDLLAVIESGLDVSRLTEGAFDMTFASCGGLWSFRDERIPSSQAIEECLPLVDWRSVELDVVAGTVALAPGSAVGVGGIGKGYGVDRAAAVLEAHGLVHYIVDGGGDLRIRGQRGDHPWTVAVAHPRGRGTLGTLEVSEGAVVTSGDYERYFERDGVRYHHILDPRTGLPARNSHSVTVVAPDATTADAFSTGFFVLGPARAIALAEQLDGVDALVVGPEDLVLMTDGFRTRFVSYDH